MQSSQGVILLKEAMLSEIQRRGVDFNGEDCSLRAKIVKETSQYVDEMMKIDNKTSAERIEEHKTMNSVLFHKALQTSGQLVDSEGFYEHVCSSLPDVGWPFYVRCVVLCAWQNYTLDCLSELSDEIVVLDVAERLIENLKCLDCDKSVLLVRLVLSHVTSFLTNENLDRLCVLIDKALGLECDTSFEKRRAEIFVSLLAQLCGDQTEASKRIEEVLRRVLDASLVWIECLDFADTENGLGECYFAVRHFLEERSDRIDSDVVLMMRHWIKKVQTSNFNSSKNRERIQMHVRAVYGSSKFTSECIDRLIDHLVEKEDSEIAKCLFENCCKLNESHVSRLLAIDTSNVGIETRDVICSKAFSSWSLDVQDAFCGEYHERMSVEDSPPLTEQLIQELTIVFNRLYGGGNVDDDVMKAISLACLKFPMETIRKLLQHAVKNGQSDDTVKILVHVRSTCNAVVRSCNESLLVFSLRLFLVEEELGSKQWNNFLALVKELLKVEVLDLSEFVRKSLLRHLSPSPYCWRVLSVLKVVLEFSNEDQLKSVFESSAEYSNLFLLLLLLVGQIVDDCLCRYISVPFEDVDWEVLQLKSEATDVLKVANVVVLRNEFLRDTTTDTWKSTDLQWLREKLDDLHPVIEFHLQDVLYRPKNFKESCFEGMSLDNLLFVCCTSKKNYDGVISHMIENETDLFSNGFGNGILIVFVKILARLTASELQTAMELLLKFHSCSSEFSGSLHETLLTVVVHVTDACLVLFPCNSAVLTHPHMIRVIQNVTTAFKNVIDSVERLPNEALFRVIMHVVRMIRGICDASQTAPKLLILSLLKDFAVDSSDSSPSYDSVQRGAVESIVGNVNDDAFVGRVKQVLGYH